MPPPRPPNRISPLNFPVFGMSWYGNPGNNGSSIVAYCGGGGSAKTGVNNSIVLQCDDDLPLQINTHDKVGVALHIYENPITHKVWLLVALGQEVHRYSLPTGTLEGVVHVGHGTNALAVNGMADQFAVGCEPKKDETQAFVKVYSMSDDEFGNDDDEPLYVCDAHTKTVCALSFSAHGGKLLSSAKDGTACVWKGDKLLAKLQCTVDEDPKIKPSRRKPQILVRGCAFADLEGKVALTVASARRGSAFLSRWVQKGEKYVCDTRTNVSNCPISAMSLSLDAYLLALGTVDGSIILWDVENWKALKVFKEIHELPVTCIAARPFPVPLKGEDDGIQMHARSASADSKLALLTLQRRGPKQKRGGGSGDGLGIMGWMHRILTIAILWSILFPVVQEARDKCVETYRKEGLTALRHCVVDDVLIAPSERPGITVPPY